MSVVRFQSNTYLRYKEFWFIWEPSWDMWRPVHSLSWTGKSFQLDDSSYLQNPMDILYGFGTFQMKQLCDKLSEMYSPEQARDVSFLSFGNAKWWRDRMVAVCGCADQSVDSWKRMCRGKPRTCRQMPKGKKLTRRQVN